MEKSKLKRIVLLVTVLTVLVGTVGGTLAFLADKTEELENVFTPSKVVVTVTDDVNGNVKSNVVIKNTGDTDSFIRAAIVGNWVKDGKIVAPWDESQGTFSGKPGSDWVKKDGYYYYTKSVKPGDPTGSALFTSYTAPDAPVEGAHLEMDILAQAVQSSPEKAVNEAWGVVPSKLAK